jgi:hypothetical protein
MFRINRTHISKNLRRRRLVPDQGGRTDIELHECSNMRSPKCTTGCIATTPSTFTQLDQLLSLEEGFNTVEVYGSGNACGPLPDTCE